MENFLKLVNKPEEESTSQTASPKGKALTSSSDSEDQGSVTVAQTVTLNTQNHKSASSSAVFTEAGGSHLEEEALGAAVSGSDDGQGVERQENGCGRQLLSLDIPDYLRADTEDISQGTSVSYKLGIHWQQPERCLPKVQHCVGFRLVKETC